MKLCSISYDGCPVFFLTRLWAKFCTVLFRAACFPSMFFSITVFDWLSYQFNLISKTCLTLPHTSLDSFCCWIVCLSKRMNFAALFNLPDYTGKWVSRGRMETVHFSASDSELKGKSPSMLTDPTEWTNTVCGYSIFPLHVPCAVYSPVATASKYSLFYFTFFQSLPPFQCIEPLVSVLIEAHKSFSPTGALPFSNFVPPSL